MHAVTSKYIKTAVMLLLGFVLAWPNFCTVSAFAVACNAKSICCCSHSGSKQCPTPACCTKPADNRAPFGPAPRPSISQNEGQAVAASFSTLQTFLAHPAGESPSCETPWVSVTAVPIFQRDCSYLLWDSSPPARSVPCGDGHRRSLSV